MPNYRIVRHVNNDEPAVSQPTPTETTAPMLDPTIAKPNGSEDSGERPDKPTGRQRLRSTITTISLLLLAPLIALLLTAFVFQSYQVDGQSMQNTLQDNDRLIIWKLPRTWARITGHQYVPKRGDIIIINEADLSACAQPGSKQIIKRVIGLPGEHVVYGNGTYTVYNKAHPKGFDPDTTLPYGKADTALLSDPQSPNVDVTLTSDELFVSGDHRGNSCDSRELGPVTTSQIVGKLVLRILPLSQGERF